MAQKVFIGKSDKMIFDTHSHYDDEAFNDDRFSLLESMAENGVGTIVSIGCDDITSQNAQALSQKYPFVYFTAGYHPEFAEKYDDNAEKLIRRLAKDKKMVAIGEIGLDYHYDTPGRDIQKEVFIKQIKLAHELDLPIAIHCRDAVGDVMEIIRKYPARGIFHCYSGSKETAQEILKLGYYISFSGTVTFKNAKNVKETAKTVPSDRYLCETDCPYLSPEPNRGKRNDSKNLVYILKKLAEIREIPYEQALKETEENAKRVYGL